MTVSAVTESRLRPPIEVSPLATILLAIVLGSIAIGWLVSATQALLFLTGSMLGIALYQASFGFTGGWRRFATEGRSRGMRTQFLMIGLTAIIFIPLLSGVSPFDQTLVGAWAPVGVSVVLGAFLFGAGMQLGGGCGSGTLFTVGGGSSRMLVTLTGFVVGAVVGTAHLPFWLSLPSLPAIKFGEAFGPLIGTGLTLAGITAIIGILAVFEKRRHGNVESIVSGLSDFKGSKVLFGPWPLIIAALVLVAGNVMTLLLAGHPWSVTYGFGLWGAKIFSAIGIPVADWAFWQAPAQKLAFTRSVLFDVTSVMNFGVILGAALAACLAGRFAQKSDVPLASYAAAILGGLLMGYGARLSFGCNIGALFSGIASGSLHGWVWFVLAYIGSLLGIALRPLFGLDGFKKA
ncbi:YeeE/YedE family protein [Tianweitania populi]|uniref:Membrane protein n=1 Tax=Tianweitania populi TaxID=1607949 RepID=A0A8J3GLC7_9HYPH|nr:YeeE/YedE family protein [Tianweitania populi]GHD20880.1 membrane protein [Tianweitania populi]